MSENDSLDEHTEEDLPPSTFASSAQAEELGAVEVIHKQQVLTKFDDHFSFHRPSSKLQYADAEGNITKVVCVETNDSQLLLETFKSDEDDEHHTVLKQYHHISESLKALRTFYTFLIIFWGGFVAVFGTMVLLFLTLDFTIFIGQTSIEEQPNVAAAIGALLAFPILVLGLAEALAIDGHLASDVYRGQFLFRSLVESEDPSENNFMTVVVSEWTFFIGVLGLPLLVMSASLLSKSDYWWDNSLLTWFFVMFGFYLIFTLLIINYEVRAGLEFTRVSMMNDNERGASPPSLSEIISKIIVLRQKNMYSGYRSYKKIHFGNGQNDIEIRSLSLMEFIGLGSESLLTKITKWRWLRCMYTNLCTDDEPDGRKVHRLVDSLEKRSFFTGYNWGLVNVFFRSAAIRFSAVVDGKEKISKGQFISSVLCAALGNVIPLILLISFLIWFDSGIQIVGFLIFVYIVLFVPYFSTLWRIFQVYQAVAPNLEISRNERTTNDMSTVMSEYKTRYRISELSDRGAWFVFVLEVVFFYGWPLVSLIELKNTGVSILFACTGLVVGMRHYLDPEICLQESGSLGNICGNISEYKYLVTKRKQKLPDKQLLKWRTESRISEIIQDITKAGSKYGWVQVYLFLVATMLALAYFAVSGDVTIGNRVLNSYATEYSYIDKDPLPYPTCKFGSDLGRGQPSNLLVDYAFMAQTAYLDDCVTQQALDDWFVNLAESERPTFEEQIVNDFRKSDLSSVQFKLFSFNRSTTIDGVDVVKKYAVVAVRGTSNAWDALSDVQLWGSAALFQFLRLALPFGEIFTPILDNLVDYIADLEASSVQDVSYYKSVSNFIAELQSESYDFDEVFVTGHSLGGGLAMIAGSLQKVPAIAISGPNTVISGKIFGISVEDLNTYTFNVIPDRDVVPMLDDRARMSQQISCRADLNGFIDCHSIVRTVCELLYTCGSGDRPVPKQCFCDFGYDYPVSNENVPYMESNGECDAVNVDATCSE